MTLGLYGLKNAKPEDPEVVPARDINVRNYVITFFSETSLQGLPPLMQHQGILKKLFWGVCISICILGLYFELNVFLSAFLQWQASTRISIVQPRSLYFPAVTVCNSNPVRSGWWDAHHSAESSTWQPSGNAASLPNATALNKLSSDLNNTGPVGAGSGVDKIDGVSPDDPNHEDLKASGGILDVNDRKKRSGPEVANPSSSVGGMKENLSARLGFLYETMSAMYNTSEEEREAAGHQLCDTVLAATFNGHELNVAKSFTSRFWNSEFGNCFTFNIGSELTGGQKDLEVDLWQARLGPYGKNVFKSATLGKNFGLYMLLNADSDQYLSNSAASGWRILVHNQTVMPFPETDGVFVKPGSSTDIQIEQKHINKLGHKDNIIYTAKYSDCRATRNRIKDDPINAYTRDHEVLYTKESCLRTCYQREVMKRCKCSDYAYPSEGSAFSDLPGYEQMSICFYNTWWGASDTTWGWNCKNDVWLDYAMGEDDIPCSQCVDTCSSVTYDLSLSSQKWPSPSRMNVKATCANLLETLAALVNETESTCRSLIRERFQENNGQIAEMFELGTYCGSESWEDLYWADVASNAIGQRYGEVYIYYRTFDYQSVDEFETYSLADLIPYFGGIVGLFFGFTILTLCEYVLLICDLVVIGLAKAFGRSKANTVGMYPPNMRRPSMFPGQPTVRHPMTPRNMMHGTAQAQGMPPSYSGSRYP